MMTGQNMITEQKRDSADDVTGRGRGHKVQVEKDSHAAVSLSYKRQCSISGGRKSNTV